MNLEIKILIFFLIALLLPGCSLNKNSRIWTKDTIVKKEKILKIKKLFTEQKVSEKEFNSNLQIKLDSKIKNNNLVNSINNSGQYSYNGKLEKIYKFKYSTINSFGSYEAEIAFDKSNVIFFNGKGSILKFDNYSKLLWEKNYYTKKEKSKEPFLFFASSNKILVIADTSAKYYALNIFTGNLLWIKKNVAPFNSEIKIYKDKFFIVDYENTLRCFSLVDGEELWNFRTTVSTIKSQKKTSVIVMDNIVYFTNSIGDITAVNAENGSFVWQKPTQKSNIYADSFFLKTSDLISDLESVFFSNNKNDFFSFDLKSGILNWKQNINSIVRPTLIDNLLFTVTNEGFLIVIEKNSGNILRKTNVFNQFKKKKKKKNIKPEGFVVGLKNIYLTTNNGRLLIIDILTGRTKEMLKLDQKKISRPFILNQGLFIIKNNSIIKLN